MALIRYIGSDEKPQLYFAIVADDTHAEYVWPMDDEDFAWFESDERLEMLLTFDPDNPPMDAQGWIDLASLHLNGVSYEDVEVADFKMGREVALRRLIPVDPPHETPGYTPSSDAADAWGSTVPNFPALGEIDENGEDMDPQATLTWVLQTLGPIDPKGPNGWLIRAADGEPLPEDEGAYIHWNLAPYAPDTDAPEQSPEVEAPKEVETPKEPEPDAPPAAEDDEDER